MKSSSLALVSRAFTSVRGTSRLASSFTRPANVPCEKSKETGSASSTPSFSLMSTESRRIGNLRGAMTEAARYFTSASMARMRVTSSGVSGSRRPVRLAVAACAFCSGEAVSPRPVAGGRPNMGARSSKSSFFERASALR